jgi:hypothetical protein
MTSTTKNGTGRRQLSDQIDRLDGVIDALDVGLKGAVTDAVEAVVAVAVKEAVQGVLLEVLTNPALRQKIQEASAPAPRQDEAARPAGSWWSRACSKVRSAARSFAGGIGTALQAARLGWTLAGDKVKTLAVAAAGVAAGFAYAARDRIASAAGTAVGIGKDLIQRAGGSLGRLAPAFAS